jgi:metal-sulfur cluster biosynthetic enzyme
MTISTEQTMPTTRIVLTQEYVLALLRGVRGPHSGLDIVTLGWVGEVTVSHPQVIVTLHPAGRICATYCAIETVIERALQTHLGSHRLRLWVRWSSDWHPDDE